ncbi:MAG: EAL and modified HD-GYP domain-containing signal transduction protein [Mariniblastus sp.]|jgi:EAL and modified HD-GYP domain-containing signal transduction protein
MSSAFVGRHPIYTSDYNVEAYEVLFRDGPANQASFIDGDQATAELIFTVFAEMGIDQIVDDRRAFINVTRQFIVDRHAFSLPKSRVVLEVLEDVTPDAEVIAALEELSEAGYKIALDDFVYSPELIPLVEIADIIKVELPAIRQEDLPAHVAKLRKYDVKLLAEKVETYEEFEFCKQLGFDYFQGYFFCKPKVIESKRISVNRIAAIQLMSLLQKPTASIDDLTRSLSSEPSLCYQLLQYVNSAACATSYRVDSVKSAIVMIGQDRFKSFVRLALLARITDDKPPFLIVTALVRARMCELIAVSERQPRPEMYFIAGLFSVLDALIDKSMDEALGCLALDQEIEQALLYRTGAIAAVLECVISYDQAQFEKVHLDGMCDADIRNAYFEAVAWAAEASVDMADT